MASSFVGYFFVPGPLEGQKVSQGRSSDTLIRLEAFKRIFLFRPKSTFLQGVSPWFLAKIDQILKSAFFTCLCPSGSRRVEKLPWESFLSANNALTKNFLFNSHHGLVFCGLFLCPWSLGRPKKCLRGRLRTH